MKRYLSMLLVISLLSFSFINAPTARAVALVDDAVLLLGGALLVASGAYLATNDSVKAIASDFYDKTTQGVKDFLTSAVQTGLRTTPVPEALLGDVNLYLDSLLGKTSVTTTINQTLNHNDNITTSIDLVSMPKVLVEGIGILNVTHSSSIGLSSITIPVNFGDVKWIKYHRSCLPSCIAVDKVYSDGSSLQINKTNASYPSFKFEIGKDYYKMTLAGVVIASEYGLAQGKSYTFDTSRKIEYYNPSTTSTYDLTMQATSIVVAPSGDWTAPTTQQRTPTDKFRNKELAIPLGLPGVVGKRVDDVLVDPGTIPQEGTTNPPAEGTTNPPTTGGTTIPTFTVPPTATINLEPLLIAGESLKTKFPFSIPWDLKNQLNVFNVTPKTPKINVDIPQFVKVGSFVMPLKFNIDFSMFDPVAAAARWFFTIAVDIAFILSIRRLLPE